MGKSCLLAFRHLTAVVLVAACDDEAARQGALSGSIAIDGSSTVFPITEAVAEEFILVNRRVRITVGISGTGGGFHKFCFGETAIQNASRPISSSEVAACASNGIEFIEMPVAYDAVSIVVHPKNNWAECVTVAELRRLWEPEAQGKITNWNQLRESWPNRQIRLFGPGTDVGDVRLTWLEVLDLVCTSQTPVDSALAYAVLLWNAQTLRRAGRDLESPT